MFAVPETLYKTSILLLADDGVILTLKPDMSTKPVEDVEDVPVLVTLTTCKTLPPPAAAPSIVTEPLVALMSFV